MSLGPICGSVIQTHTQEEYVYLKAACAISGVTLGSESPSSELRSGTESGENLPHILEAVGMRDPAGL